MLSPPFPPPWQSSMTMIHYCRSVHCVKMPDSAELESALAVMRECVELIFMLHGKVYTYLKHLHVNSRPVNDLHDFKFSVYEYHTMISRFLWLSFHKYLFEKLYCCKIFLFVSCKSLLFFPSAQREGLLSEAAPEECMVRGITLVYHMMNEIHFIKWMV